MSILPLPYSYYSLVYCICLYIPFLSPHCPPLYGASLHYSNTLSVTLYPSLYFPCQDAMKPEKKMMSMSDTKPVSEPIAVREALNKLSPNLDLRSTVLNPSGPYPITTIDIAYSFQSKLQPLLLPTLWLNLLKRSKLASTTSLRASPS